MYLSIKELLISDDEESGIQAISFVDNPAIETNFQYFARQKSIIRSIDDIREEDLTKQYRWVLGSGGENCDSCKIWAAKDPMPLKEWFKTAIPRAPVGSTHLGFKVEQGWSGEPPSKSTYYNTHCEENCKCHLEQVGNNFEHHFVKMEMFNEVKKEVIGLVLKSGQMIYRNDVGDGLPGYVYFSRDTVRKLKEKYGWNRAITFQHLDKITGSAILMDTYLDESDNQTKWFVKYKIINEKLWNKIKDNSVRGFSIELKVS